MITVRLAKTVSGADVAEFLDGERVVARLYSSPDGKKLRLALPELGNFAQVRIRLEERVVDFERDAAAARRSVTR